MGLILIILKTKRLHDSLALLCAMKKPNRENRKIENVVVPEGSFLTADEMTLLLPPVDRLRVHFRLEIRL